MLRKPLSKAPSHCSLCELRHDGCDICPSRKTHCMKYHVQIVPFIRPCEWRDKAKVTDIRQALAFANSQLREFFKMRHLQKEKSLHLRSKAARGKKARGLTRRLTITPDFFRD